MKTESIIKGLWIALHLTLLPIPFLPAQPESFSQKYRIDMTRFDVDSFFITLDVKGLTGDSAVYQFAVTAPGTYSILDAGRFIGGFSAYDTCGKPLSVVRRNENRFVIWHASRLARITYQADDTFNKEINENPVLPMSGTNLENTNAVVNHQMLVGYFCGFKDQPVEVAYLTPPDWSSGAAFQPSQNIYKADNYDQLVASPMIFARRMTADSLSLNRSKILIYCFSESGRMEARNLKVHITKTMQAANKFLKGLPVERYAFLFHFRRDVGGIYGAWEHRNASIYVIPENDISMIDQTILTITAHEFFHVVTPLSVCSDSIRPFAYDRTVPTRHLWFFEGVTEWASDMMLLRNGVLTENQFMDQISLKLNRNDAYDASISLVDLSLGSFGRYGKQYQNIYEKGAVVAWLLDLRLLELSKGKSGLRELVLKLSERYNLNQTFKDEEFLNTIVEMTYPEIRTFIERYIQGNEPLPVGEYLNKIGYHYIYARPTGRYIANTGSYEMLFEGNKVLVSNVDPNDSVNRTLGLQNGDELVELKYLNFNVSVNDASFYYLFYLMAPGQPFQLKVIRNGQPLILEAIVGEKEDIIRHQILPLQELTDEQKKFRKWWLKRL